jgi:hypothetical protein
MCVPWSVREGCEVLIEVLKSPDLVRSSHELRQFACRRRSGLSGRRDHSQSIAGHGPRRRNCDLRDGAPVRTALRRLRDTRTRYTHFGWKGEVLRHVSPTTRPRDMHFSDWTGARLAAGVVHAVTDVKFEPIEESDRRMVWFKLVATDSRD